MAKAKQWDRSRLLSSIAAGESLDTAASSAGITRRTVERVAASDPEFRAELAAARATRDPSARAGLAAAREFKRRSFRREFMRAEFERRATAPR